jgi:NTP pyrophosphatase (non-canonical NTP hydrolase)
MNGITVDYKRLGWDKASQWLKIGEELGEVVKAIIEDNPVEEIKESLDVMETMWTRINMVADEYGINIKRLVNEHNQKLKDKGYLKEEV